MPINLGNPMMRCRRCDYAVSAYSDEAREKFVWFDDPTDEAHGGHFRCWDCLTPTERDEFGRLARQSLAAMRRSRA